MIQLWSEKVIFTLTTFCGQNGSISVEAVTKTNVCACQNVGDGNLSIKAIISK